MQSFISDDYNLRGLEENEIEIWPEE